MTGAHDMVRISTSSRLTLKRPINHHVGQALLPAHADREGDGRIVVSTRYGSTGVNGSHKGQPDRSRGHFATGTDGKLDGEKENGSACEFH